MLRNLTGAEMMMAGLATGLAAEMDRGPFWEPRDHSSRLDAVFGERDRHAAEAKRARKNAKRAALQAGAQDGR